MGKFSVRISSPMLLPGDDCKLAVSIELLQGALVCKQWVVVCDPADTFGRRLDAEEKKALELAEKLNAEYEMMSNTLKGKVNYWNYRSEL